MGRKCFKMIEYGEHGLNILSMFSILYITILSNIKYSNNSIEVGLGCYRGKGVCEIGIARKVQKVKIGLKMFEIGSKKSK